jgi:hypothetical protein
MLFGLLMAASVAIAAPPEEEPLPEIQKPHPTLADPTVAELTGNTCPNAWDVGGIEVGLVKQDPLTLYWSGNVYGQLPCSGTGYPDPKPATIFEGCALVQWDTTGTTYTIQKILWRRDTRRSTSSRDCFVGDGNAMS